jgi:dehydrogenase/reductase SDR family protein 12
MQTGRHPPSLRTRLADVFAFGFDATGFERHAADFVDEPAPDLAGRRVLLTGATSGIGRATVERLAAMGMSVTAWGRDPARTAALAEAIGGDAAVADLGEPEAIVAAVDALQGAYDVVVCNAGSLPDDRILTAWGRELVWSTQVLGHVLLLRRMRAKGLLAPGCRVVWVASGGMYLSGLSLRDVDWDARDYDGTLAYANAKRAQVVLGEQLQEAWPEVRMAVMHPGWADTKGVQTSLPRFRALLKRVLRTSEQGADTIVWLATTDAAWPGGRFWFDRAEVPTVVLGRTRPSARRRQQLWDHVMAETAHYLTG